MEILSDVLPMVEIKSESENISAIVEPEIRTEEIVIAPPVSLNEEEFFTEEVINETSVHSEIKVEQEKIIANTLTLIQPADRIVMMHIVFIYDMDSISRVIIFHW